MSRRAKLAIYSCAALIALVTLCAACVLWPILTSPRGASKAANAKELLVTPAAQGGQVIGEVPGSNIECKFLFAGGCNGQASDWARARKILGGCGDYLSAWRQAAKRFADSSGKDTKARETLMANGEEIASLACSRAIVSAHDGNMAASAEDVELSIVCCGSWKLPPYSFWDRAPTTRLISATIPACLAYGRFPEQESRKICNMLSRIDLASDLRRELRWKRKGVLIRFKTLDESDRTAWLAAIDQKDKSGTSVTGRSLSRVIGKLDEWHYRRQMAELMQTVRLPYREIRRRKLDKDPALDAPRYAVVSRQQLLPVHLWTYWRDAGIASIRASGILLGIDAHHARFNRYPDTLNDLRSRLRWQVEPDPFSGSDFIYKRLPNGFVLYSVGANLRDDGGKPYRPKNDVLHRTLIYMTDEVDCQSGDIVWRVERKP